MKIFFVTNITIIIIKNHNHRLKWEKQICLLIAFVITNKFEVVMNEFFTNLTADFSFTFFCY